MLVPRIIHGGLGTAPPIDRFEVERDAAKLKKEFLACYDDRGLTSDVKKWDDSTLTQMFAVMSFVDPESPEGSRPATIFDLLSPTLGRGLIVQLVRLEAWKKLKKRTRAKKLGVLRRFIRFVLDDPFIPGFTSRQSIHGKYGEICNPLKKDDSPRLSELQPEEGAVLTRQQLWALYDFLYEYCKKNPNDLEIATIAAMVFVAAESGLRISELVMLNVIGQVDLLFDTHELRTRHGKGAKATGKRSRSTIMTPHAEATLKGYLQKVRSRRPNHDKIEAVFLQPDGRRMSTAMARYWLKRVLLLAKEAGIALPKGITFHTFRRTFATLFDEDGPHRVSELMMLLGHRNLSTFPRYVLHSDEWITERIKVAYSERCAR
jgi:integrase